MIDFGHFGSLHRLVASFVINHQQTLVADDLVFIEHLFGAGKIALGIDVLNVDLSFPRVLIFRQQILHVRADGCVRGKENSNVHLAFDGAEETFRLVRECIFLVAGKIPAFVMSEGDGIHHRGEKQNEDDLRQNVKTDLDASDFFRTSAPDGLFSHRHSLHLRDWNA